MRYLAQTLWLREEAALDLDKYGPIPTAGDPDFVVCSECGSEFQPHIKVCIDCGAATVPPEAARARVRDRPAAGSPDADDEDKEDVAIRTDELEWIEDLQELFERHGISSRIRPVDSSGRPQKYWQARYTILVAEEDALRAFALDRELLRQRLGDEGDELVDIPAPGTCPSCHAQPPAGAVECPDCGLALAARNLEIVQKLYEAFGNQDRDQILVIFDPDIEWIQNEGFPGGGSYAGAETVLNEVFAGLAAAWETGRPTSDGGWTREIPSSRSALIVAFTEGPGDR